MKILLKYLTNFLNTNYSNFFYFIPVLYGIGVGTYFAMPSEPNLYYLILSLISSILGYTLIKQNLLLNILAKIAIIIMLGLTLTSLNSSLRSSEEFDYVDQFAIVEARIINIQKYQKSYRITFTDLDFKNLEYFTNNYKIRVKFRTIPENLSEGDIVAFKAILSKPSWPILPDHFNFARYAYFENIKAVGYGVSQIQLIQKNTNNSYLNKIRVSILENIYKTLNTVNGSIASALIIGEYSQLPNNILDDMRISGLAHILSVSGLHMTVISSIFFFFCRQILACFSTIALNYNLKKISSIAAIIGGYFYLLLTGLQIAAVRSYIMTSLFLLAILIDRIQIGMRSIAIAALLILIFCPEYIIHPSFQMSFAAILALISVYELLAKNNISFKHRNFFLNLSLSGISLLFSSLVASLAIAPFAAYHFNQASYYSMIANLLAVPIISIYIMPLMIISIFFYPIGLMHIPLKLSNIGINYVVQIAHFVAKLPYSYSTTKHLDTNSLIIITIGGLWFLLWQRKSRYLGFIIIAYGFLTAYFSELPDIIVDQKGSIVLKDSKNRVVFFNTIYSKLKKDVYSKYFGHQNGISFKEYFYQDLDFSCNEQFCLLNIKKKRVAILNQNDIKECPKSIDIMIDAKSQLHRCEAMIYINQDNLNDLGSHLIYINPKKNYIYFKTAINDKINRLWHKKN